jgi:hypothetical protein
MIVNSFGLYMAISVHDHEIGYMDWNPGAVRRAAKTIISS